jgi:hypothetical protein
MVPEAEREGQQHDMVLLLNTEQHQAHLAWRALAAPFAAVMPAEAGELAATEQVQVPPQLHKETHIMQWRLLHC